MYIEQFYVKKIAHSSYMIAGSDKCAIVDPKRDVDVYIKKAKEMGFEITHILETHLHADFISGHMDLAQKTGAKIYAPKSAGCKFDHKALEEGDSFKIENIKFEVVETPGHTPEHINYIVTDLGRGDDPLVAFTGDTLFVGDVGRPDLFPNRAEELAGKLFESLKKLKKLPDFCEVLPAHGEGSLCGRAMGAKRRSTIGYEKKYNEPFKMTDKDKFVHSLTNDMPPAPDHFSRCTVINTEGPKLIKNLSKIKPMTPVEFKKETKKDENIVLDVRSYDAFGAQHIKDSYNIDFGGNMPTFAGWIIPPEKNILIVADDEDKAKETVTWLLRVGLDNSIGFLDGELPEWAKNGYETAHFNIVSVPEFVRLKGKGINILDVRAPGEYTQEHIEESINIPAPELRERYTELNKAESYYIICGSGHRSGIACALLEKNGFTKINNVAGGMTGYNKFVK